MNLRRALISAGTAVILAAGIAGCTPAPEPTAAPTPSASAPSPTPTPTPTPTPEPEVRVVITTLTLDVYTDDALTSSWAHADRDPTEIPGLTQVFGTEPVVTSETRPGEGGRNDYAIYSWPGFELRFISSEFGRRNVWVTATAASLGAVSIEAADGVQVGDDAQSLAAAYPELATTIETPTGDVLRVKLSAIPTGREGSDGPAADFVAAYSTEPFTTVTSLYAPALNYGS